MIQPDTRIALLLLGTTLLSACASAPGAGAARPFPPDAKQADTVDIQVMRRETVITLTNTSARSFAPGTLWINRQYSAPIGALDVGQTVTLPLSSFRNEYSESFRGGGFFATEKPDVIAQVLLEQDGALVGLVMVGDR